MLDLTPAPVPNLDLAPPYLFTRSKVQQFPVNLRPNELITPREPKVQYDDEESKQDDWGVVHVRRRDGQLRWEADEGPDDCDE